MPAPAAADRDPEELDAELVVDTVVDDCAAGVPLDVTADAPVVTVPLDVVLDEVVVTEVLEVVLDAVVVLDAELETEYRCSSRNVGAGASKVSLLACEQSGSCSYEPPQQCHRLSLVLYIAPGFD